MTTKTQGLWDGLHQQQKHQLKWPSEHVVRWVSAHDGKGKSALDIGCGAGRHISVLWECGADVVATDSSAEAVEYCEIEWGALAKMKQADMRDLPFDADMFDLALAYGVFYYGSHWSHVAAARELHRVLKPGGQALVVTRTDRDSRRTAWNLMERMQTGDEAGMMLNFLTEEMIPKVYRDFSHVTWERTETTRLEREWVDSDWLITVTK